MVTELKPFIGEVHYEAPSQRLYTEGLLATDDEAATRELARRFVQHARQLYGIRAGEVVMLSATANVMSTLAARLSGLVQDVDLEDLEEDLD